MDGKTYLDSANALVQKGRYDEALTLLSQAARIHPDFYLYHTRIGELQLNSGRHEAAITAYQRAAQLRPDIAWLRTAISQLQSSRAVKIVGSSGLSLPATAGRRAEGGLRLTGVFKESHPAAPLVTIITVVFNNTSTLQRCIDSVKSQTYANIEYLIIDGGSRQPTLDLIRRNQAFIDYFISEPDRGIYAAMNKGLKLARGHYICLLNSDDYYEPTFVEKTISAALSSEQAVDVVYTNYWSGSEKLVAQAIDSGVLFGHLNICHNTFLAKRECYDRVGGYDESFRIVSDAVWIRNAYLEGAKFLHLNEPLFTLTDGGLSSGQTEAHRKLFVGEAVRSYRANFRKLPVDDAELIYQFRFSKHRLASMCSIAARYRTSPSIAAALRNYVAYCLRSRSSFCFSVDDLNNGLFSHCLKLIGLLELDLNIIQFNGQDFSLSNVLQTIDEKLALKKPSARKRVLHFITVFSAPTETFVYDLLGRLDSSEDYDNFVLFESRQLEGTRPYAKALQVDWDVYPKAIAEQIYKYIVSKLRPDLLIGHFALNEWKWSQRVSGLGINLPTISMCHGIDVFSLRNKADYRTYLVKQFAQRKDTAFTAVSGYLKEVMQENGLPAEKIHLVPNTVNPRFFAARKRADYFDGQRTLKLLSVGRLIGWKGHSYLLDGLAEFKRHYFGGVHLTIVYGNGDQKLSELLAQVDALGLAESVTFERYVNFQKDPGYYANFDCFVHPSTYSEDQMHASETFGVSVLEAIAAGLPVITTDAGGLPEVVGEEKRFARIVPHANAGALANALTELVRQKGGFSDNTSYAEERLTHFSAQAQLEALSKVIESLTTRPPRIALISSYTKYGAGFAAFRVHKGLRQIGISSDILTTNTDHIGQPGVRVIGHPSNDEKNWRGKQPPPKSGHTIFSLNERHIPSSELLRLVEPYDIINLHWHARFLSVDNVAALTHTRKPIVMTIRDMQPITGGCHFFHGCNKWQTDCSECPQIPVNNKNLPADILAAKRARYNFKNLTLVTLSQHTRSILEKAPYFNQCRIETIPNSIQLDVFHPHDKSEVRKEFGLPLDRKIIGYVPSSSSEVKGYQEMLAALQLLEATMPGAEAPFVMLVGNKTPIVDSIHQDKKVLGYIHDNETLARAYSAADIVVVPSLEETFSNTVAEAISCGVPVVGFRTGAIPDLAIAGISGACVELGDVDALATSIRSVLNGPDLSQSARLHAETVLAFTMQAERYRALYQDLLGAK